MGSFKSILVLACATGDLMIEVAQASSGSHGRIVGVEESHLAVQLTIRKLDELNLLGDKKLLCGNTYNFDAQRSLRSHRRPQPYHLQLSLCTKCPPSRLLSA